jgi:ribulose bisphosphate carboxylase small subunit
VKNSTPSNIQRVDALLNVLIGDASTTEQIRYWTIKRDFKAALNHVDDERAEQLAGALLREFAAEAA